MKRYLSVCSIAAGIFLSSCAMAADKMPSSYIGTYEGTHIKKLVFSNVDDAFKFYKQELAKGKTVKLYSAKWNGKPRFSVVYNASM